MGRNVRRAERMPRAVRAVCAVYMLTIFGTGAAWAIPSPELIVGSVTSLSQLISLLAATLGGGALMLGSRSGSGSGQSRAATQTLRRLVLACGLIAIASLALNAYLYSSAQQEKRDRLEAALLRPTPKAKGATLDPLLREIPYKDQVTHPLGLDTADAELIVTGIVAGERPDWMILDIRETAETEVGSFPTSVKVRFPDLPTSDIDLTSRKALLICHNGNRSAETCAALAARGIDCRFIRGGLEKWLTEQRPIAGLGARSIEDLRAIPDYPNHQTLLETSEVKRLVADEKALFVDVRYPGEFAASHLPGAVNIPLRSTPSTEIAATIAKLPKTAPIIAPCYDRRSCFFAEIIGLTLSRAGADFRGRYTVPWEYFVPAPRPPHVEQFLAEQNRSLFTRLSEIVAHHFGRLAEAIGFLAAILLAALASRIAVLPVSLKAERDQATAKRIEPEVAALKARLVDDPARFGRAMRAIYRREGLTPLRNLLALLFLPLMAVISVAVQQVAERQPATLLWLPALAAPDPLYVMPLAASAALAFYLALAFAPKGAAKVVLWAVALPMLTASLAFLGAGICIYVLVSALLLLGQRAIVTGNLGAAVGALTGWTHRRRLARDIALGIVPLGADPAHLAATGNKALHLSRLKAEGLVVPDGFVLTGRFLAVFQTLTPAERARHLDRLWRRIVARRLAVRSSAEAEDGAAHSFAGVFDSVLDVDRAGLERAIAQVVASFHSDRVRAYGFDGGIGNVIVQRMIEARYAGVLFTRDPVAAGFMMVELVEGTGDALVSGAATPQTFRFSRLPDAAVLHDQPAPPIDLAPLLAIGRRAEASFGAPQDIEWAYADGQFYLVQSRDIVGAGRDTATGIVQAEWSRVMAMVEGTQPDTVVFAQNEMSEMLPRPTPLSLSLMNDFWASGGSLDLACRRLGLGYAVEEDSPPLVVSIMGRLYVDQRQAALRAPAIGALDARRLRRCGAAVEDDFNNGFLPRFLREIAVAEVADYDRLGTGRLVAEFAHRHAKFVTDTHVAVDVVNVLAQFYLQDASLALRKLGADPLSWLAPHEPTEPQRIAAAAAVLSGLARQTRLLDGFGHRAVLDYELAHPRFAEDTAGLDALVAGASIGATPASAPAGSIDAATRSAVDRAVRFQALKETAKHHSLRELAVLRRIALALDRRLALDGHVFMLDIGELETATPENAARLGQLARARAHRRTVMEQIAPLPAILTPADLLAASAGLDTVATSTATIRGTRVAGAGIVFGRARVICAQDAEQGGPIENFEDGDIIVARMIHPAWIVYFSRAGGLVSELGGWLSHTALIARESDLAMIVGVRGLAAIADGARLRLEPDGSVQIVTEADQRLAAE